LKITWGETSSPLNSDLNILVWEKGRVRNGKSVSHPSLAPEMGYFSVGKWGE